ncbi:DUF692 family multinuclear iron-containing protein [Paraflavitalea pollutisoli]|uniref:multinuclear nonheme iron-dependent oxidase n=1 Tax=Paraflavitalea pollutisoli TaxID=3034143 RepID=UPI0023EBE958|nr:DUF692 family multinuclear iron-containing protein [Paraflavitalea sp. H1-2-19X]
MLEACLPLLEEARVEALEWSFDVLYQTAETPAWFHDLLTAFSKEERLIGHGVFFSLFSGRWLPEQDVWLQHLRTCCATFHFDHITEHFGFMTGTDFHQGAPLNIPYTASTLAIGQDRLKRIYEACACPVGLENLAFAYSIDDVQRQGSFLDELLHPINGFIILDLHNLWCQLHNFSIPYEQLIHLYPLDRVREIHISGGSWDDSLLETGRRIRRDTHDDAVPAAVFDLFRQTIPRCPHLKYVVMEQLGNGLTSHKSKQQFYADFVTMASIVDTANQQREAGATHAFLPAEQLYLGQPLEDETLYQQQRELANILESAGSFDAARHLLLTSSLAGTAWHVEQWDAAMIETAVKIAQKWKEGF